MARDPADVAATKLLRQTLSKFGVDSGQADLRVSHGIATIRGCLMRLKDVEANHSGDLKSTVENAAKSLRGKQGIKDVVIDCSFRG